MSFDELEETAPLFLEYGDIVKIFASSNKELNQQTFYIKYIDAKKIQLLNISSLHPYTLNYKEGNEGVLRDESIEEIHIIWKSPKKGYATQNGMQPHKWIHIQFAGELYLSVSGEITDLQDDQIEVTVYPNLEIIYIDFEYKGLPETIEKIKFIPKPQYVDKPKKEMEEGEVDEDTDKQQASIEFSENNELIIKIPDKYGLDTNIRDNLHNMYVNANEIIFDDDEVEWVNQIVEIDAKQKIYGLDEQITSLLDELLSTIPNNARTKHVMDDIQRIIKNFKYLRTEFSKTDPYGNIKSPLILGKTHKPLVEKISSLSSNLKWLIPVVSLEKTLYSVVDEDEDEGGDEVDNVYGMTTDLAKNLKELQSIQDNYFKNKNGEGAIAKYPNLIKSFDKTNLPFSTPITPPPSIILSAQVNTNLETVIDNLKEFKTIVCKNANINTHKFVTQKFVTGLPLNWTEGKKHNSQELIPNEPIHIKSWIMLPEQIMRFSKIDMPTTNILCRSLYSQKYPLFYRLFNNLDTKLERVKIDLPDPELNFEQIEKDTGVPFLSSFKDYSVSEPSEELGTRRSFIQKIIPNTFELISLLQKYVHLNEHSGYSFLGMVKMLEPFYIYPKNITYGVYVRIRYFIKQSIIEWKNKQSLSSREYRFICDKLWDVNETHNPLVVIFKENPELQNYYYGTYNRVFEHVLNKTEAETKTEHHNFVIHDNKIKSSEILTNMLGIDNGSSLSTLLHVLSFPLTIPTEVIDKFNAETEGGLTPDEMEKIKPSSCYRKILTKKYKSLKELQNDNHKEIYYDAEFDKTPYELLTKDVKSKKEKMTNELFLEYFAEVLVQKSSVPRPVSLELAEAIIAGKKIVNDGEYAVLEIYPEYTSTNRNGDGDGDNETTEEQYLEHVFFIRTKNIWKRDDTTENANAFMDNNTLLCNMNKNGCVKKSQTAVCQDTRQTRQDITAKTKSSLFKEFEIRVGESIKSSKEKLEKEIKRNITFCKKIDRIRYLQLYKDNKYAYDLGTVQRNKNDGNNEYSHSRWETLLDKIISQTDFIKKQKDILVFAEQFTREPLVETLNETPHWFYCRESNNPLLPIYMYELAKAFVSGGSEEYSFKLKEIVQKYGTLSEDGDNIVDKLGGSGRVITAIDFVEEEFDEAGTKIQKHNVEKDNAERVADAIAFDLPGQKKKKQRIFENETNETIYNVLFTLCNNMDIPTEDIEDMVIRVSSEIAKTIIVDEKKYLKKTEKIEKAKSYAHYSNQNIILIVAFVAFVAIQTATPVFRPKHTFPGCVLSFAGFPFGKEGEENTDGLKYMACVLNNSKSSIGVWASIKGINVSVLIKTMKEVISKHVIERPDILDRLQTRQHYLAVNPNADIDTTNIPAEQSIQKWKHFMPPLIKYNNISNEVQPFPTNFFQGFKKSIIGASPVQWSELGLLKTKIFEYTFSVIEKINVIVKKNDPILNTSSYIPYLQNACCNDKNTTSALDYFKEKEPNIANYIEIAKKLAESIQLNDILSLAPIFIHIVDTSRKSTIIPTVGHSSENIYTAFIYYCKFDNDGPIPEYLKGLVSVKPQHGYNPQWSILEKTEFLKENGKNYNVSDLENLILLVNQHNQVVQKTPDDNLAPIIPNTERMIEYMNHLDYIDNNIIEGPLKKHLHSVLSKYEHHTLLIDDNTDGHRRETETETNVLKNYLIYSNKKMLETINQFMDEYRGSIERNKMDRVQLFLQNFVVWEDTTDEQTPTMVQYTKNAIQELVNIFPTMIKTNKPLLKTIPAHWELSVFHCVDVEKFVVSYYTPLMQFLGDTTICELLEQTEETLRPLIDFVNYIPVIQPLKKQMSDDNREHIFYSVFDKRTIYLLFQYVFYSVIYEYVQKSNDPEMSRMRTWRETETVSPIRGAENSRNEEEENENQRLNQMQLMNGNAENIKLKTVELLVAFLSIEDETKKSIDKTYNMVSEKVIHSRLEEKKAITDYFKNMNNDERKVENTLKIMKMGRWNVGMQKGVFQYDKGVYDKEHLEIVNILDRNNELNDYVIQPDQLVRTVDDLENERVELNNHESDQEEFDISNLDEEYMDGDYYGEDDEE